MATKPIISYPNGFYASDTDVGSPGTTKDGSDILQRIPITDAPNLLSFVPGVPNGVGGNIARKSGFDTLSSGMTPGDTNSSLIGILSSPGYGQQWGCQDTTGGPGLSAYGILWRVPGKTLENTKALAGTYALAAASGVTNGTTRVVILSTPNRAGAHTHHRNTTLITNISAEIDIAVLYKNGSSATYTVSADASMENSSGHGASPGKTPAYYKDLAAGLQADDYETNQNVGPNVRRLVALGLR